MNNASSAKVSCAGKGEGPRKTLSCVSWPHLPMRAPPGKSYLPKTILEKSTTAPVWFQAMYLMGSTRCGISAKQIHETGVTYKPYMADVPPDSPAAVRTLT